jgi:hypothetical protein
MSRAREVGDLGSVVTVDDGNLIINESGADVDFRVEGDTNANLLFVDASTDRVGINASSPATKLDIRFENSTTPTSGTTPVGIGVSFGSGDGFNGGIWFSSAFGGDEGICGIGGTRLGGGYDTDLRFYTNNTAAARSFTERLRIDASGNLLVGTTNTIIWNTTNTGVVIGGASAPAIQVSRSGDASLLLNRTSSDGNIAIFARQGVSVGNISVTASATAYNTSSDYRLKENIAPMTGALAKVLELNPVTYTWKADGSAGEGFVAHELQAVVPDAVTGEKDATEIQQVEVSPAVPATYDEEGNELTPAVEAVYEEREVPKYQGVDTSFLVATLTAAIQELSAKNDALEARIAALETGA